MYITFSFISNRLNPVSQLTYSVTSLFSFSKQIITLYKLGCSALHFLGLSIIVWKCRFASPSTITSFLLEYIIFSLSYNSNFIL